MVKYIIHVKERDVIYHHYPNFDSSFIKFRTCINHCFLYETLHVFLFISYWLYYGFHDDVIKWKHFPRYWPCVRGIHRSPVNFSHKGQWWRGFDVFFDLCLNKWLSKHSWGWWSETPSRSWWRDWNGFIHGPFVVRCEEAIYLVSIVVSLWIILLTRECFPTGIVRNVWEGSPKAQ